MRHTFGNIISVVFAFIKLCLMKLIHGKKLKFHCIERISPNVVLDVDNTSTLKLGDKVRIHSGSRITAADYAEVTIGDGVKINNNCRIASRYNIKIDDGVEFGPGVLIYDHDHDFRDSQGIKAKKYKKGSVYIGKNTWIGANTIILRGTKIGDNCVVGAGSVIRGEYPDGVVIVQKRATSVEIIKRMQ